MNLPKGPNLAVLPVTKDETSPAGPRILQPSGWPAPKGYANGMTADGRLVVTGGVIGWDHQGHLQADFVAQVRQTLSNISAILAEGGARPEHLVRLTWYVVDMEEYLASLKTAWPDLSRNLRRALSGHGAGPGRAPGRKGRKGRDRGNRGGAALIQRAPPGESAGGPLISPPWRNPRLPASSDTFRTSYRPSTDDREPSSPRSRSPRRRRRPAVSVPR